MEVCCAVAPSGEKRFKRVGTEQVYDELHVHGRHHATSDRLIMTLPETFGMEYKECVCLSRAAKFPAKIRSLWELGFVPGSSYAKSLMKHLRSCRMSTESSRFVSESILNSSVYSHPRIGNVLVVDLSEVCSRQVQNKPTHCCFEHFTRTKTYSNTARGIRRTRRIQQEL